MNDLQLEKRLRAWYREEVSPRASAPDALRDALVDITDIASASLFSTRRGLILLAAAALLTAALVGAMAIGLRPVPPPPGPSPSPSAGLLPTGLVEAGSYSFDGAFTVTMPAGWTHDANFVSKGDPSHDVGVTLSNWVVTRVYGDSCRWHGTLREVGSAADVITALMVQTGHQTSGPTDVILGDYPATRMEFSVPADVDATACDGELIRIWPTVGLEYPGSGLSIVPGQTATVYVVDLYGERGMVVATLRFGNSSAADVTELDELVASIRFNR